MINKIKQKYKEFITSELNTSYIVLVIFVLWSVKIAGDLTFFTFTDIYSFLAITWRIITSIFILLLLTLYFLKNFQESFKTVDSLSTSNYFKELKILLYISLAIFVFNYFLPDEIQNYGKIQNIWLLIYIELVSIFSTVTGFYILSFLLKWLLKRKHKRTKIYIQILITSIISMIILEAPFHYYHIRSEDLTSNSLLIALSVILIISMLSIVFLTTRKNNWIAVLPKKKKWSLILLYLIGIFFSFAFIILSSGSDGESKFSMAAQFTFGTDTLLFISYFCLLPYFFKLIFSTIVTLPTTSFLERTNTEISSLTYLNRVVSQTIDFDKLIDTVTALALQTCRGIASWTEIYNKDNSISIASTQFLNEINIKSLDTNNNLSNYLQIFEKSVLIPSIKEDNTLKQLNWSALPLVNSMIIVPLRTGNRRIGTLVILHPDEYGMDEDDLKVMEAFADNINLALENAKLVQDSIDKERYRRELVLAREMEEKLLPKALPEIEGFTISAFSIPANEVGGDYYDIVKLKSGKFCVLIGDVSGKGMSSAFYMAQLKGVVMSLAPESVSASDLLKRINKTLYGKIDKQIYITLSALVVENVEGPLTFSRAGHMPLMVKTNISDISQQIKIFRPNGLGISLANNLIFDKWLEEIKIETNPGDIIVLFTDGINELRNSSNDEFGYVSLKQILENSVYNIRADEVINNLKESLLQYLGDNTAHDDMTVVVLVKNSNY
jgi:serine phosphatase RsbU (regulator of sigma subunit)